jgi:tRNA 2-thiouridine synthesizing protein E
VTESWNHDIAQCLAEKEGLVLSKEHWAVILFLREYYAQHEKAPNTRTLVNYLGLILNDESKGTSLYLHQLFPQSPIKLASKIAGLPEPARCL